MEAQPNMGSMGMGQGSQDPLQAAIAARQGGGTPVSPLNQTMQGSPQTVPPTEVPSMNQGSTSAKTPSSEAELIIKALSQRLGSLSKVDQANVGGGMGKQSY